ncbi:Pvc16 family protein [Desulfobacter curvatus]|uniref:Pvc16 family protein n=1 Tax=Desulfobacter curvatus TaxID=2290 RepID=UPI00036A262E|nr:Pvc16 family protein [Desulfobacter curvatus]
MALPTSSLARICDVIRGHVETLGLETTPVDWDVSVTIGAPGVNLASKHSKNTLNLFFYRFEPFGFDADARPGDVQWLKTVCFITAFGIDEDGDDDGEIDFSAGVNELRMLSQVMRLFQEQPVMLIGGDDTGELWHIQFIPRPLADDQINQIWSSQGDTIYRPSVVYEIALAPVEPNEPAAQAARVASIGVDAGGDIENRFRSWPGDRQPLFPAASSITVDTQNPQWAPAAVMVTGGAGSRTAHLSLTFEVTDGAGDEADFSDFPEIDIWIAGDTARTGDLYIVGQLFQNPEPDQNSGKWSQIDTIDEITADAQVLDMDALPDPKPAAGAAIFTLAETHLTGLDKTCRNWQVQLFVERRIQLDPMTNAWVDVSDPAAGLHIRSNPLLITITRDVP